MENKSEIAIIGGGASGCMCAYFLLKKQCNVTLFDNRELMRTILPTGGGRCNLAHAEYDFKELAKNYPRGEKFLYSVFSNFATCETIELFKEIGIETYTQEDDRIFPKSNSSKDVREKILKKISNAKHIKEKVIKIEKSDNGFKVTTEKSTQIYDKIVIATGGNNGYGILKEFNINIVKPCPSLVGLNTKENLKLLSGLCINKAICNQYCDDLLFTHFGVSGPLIYKISSVNAFKEFPYTISVDLFPQEFDMQTIFNQNPKKEIKNIFHNLFPQKLSDYILDLLCVNKETKACEVKSDERNRITDKIHNFLLTITGTNKGEETVTAGGIDLNEINPKTMEFKKIKNMYAIGEVLNIDGFCGGFNLQNAWSTAFIAAQGLLSD